MYGLVHNNKIQVGPRNWSYSFFNTYLTDNQLDASSLPRAAPNDAIITDDWSILPVSMSSEPSYDGKFEQLAGPFLTINETNITGYYTVQDLSVESCKSKLKTLVTNNRYAVETGELKFTFSDSQEVILYTEREDRSTYLDAYLIMGDEDTTTFKFKNAVFREVTKPELGMIVATGAQHIKNCFIWESEKHAEIDACTSIEELKLIELRHPSQITE